VQKTLTVGVPGRWDSDLDFPLEVLMVPSSVIADGEHLMCGGFSLSETICLGNFEFIANYFTT
jgi:hypothetical protein